MGDFGLMLGAIIGLLLIVGFAIFHEKLFKIDPMDERTESAGSKVFFYTGRPIVLAFAFLIAATLRG